MSMIDRRHLLHAGAATIGGAWALGSGMAATAGPVAAAHEAFFPGAGPRSRVLLINDLSGDIDGLFATVHAILSPAARLQAIVGAGTGRDGETAQRSAALASEMLRLMGMTDRVKVHEGASGKLQAPNAAVPSPGTQALIDEAMRTDTALPLYVTVGCGLTEVASALMLEPRIADRFTLVWIGGDAYPAGGTGETNFNIDRLAAQYVFNRTNVRIWQIPRSVYATCLVSDTELQAFVAPNGAIGAWLYRQAVEAPQKYRNVLNMGETWTLGDSPLVAVTALADWTPSGGTRPFQYEKTSSSGFETVPAPHLDDDGTFTTQPGGRMIRTYRSIDTRLMFGDFFAKLRVNFGA